MLGSVARKPRLHYPDAVYHVTQRGAARQPVFGADADRHRFLRLLADARDRFDHEVYAYCLMENHFHLAVRVGLTPLAAIMQRITSRYAQAFNKRHDRIGPLFQGRYKAALVDADAYLLQLIAYIHLNPVRAGLVTGPGDYRWSSHRAYLGQERADWLATDPVLRMFGRRPSQVREAFARFVIEGLSARLEEPAFGSDTVSGSTVYGDDAFAAKALARAKQATKPARTLQAYVGAVCAAAKITPDELFGPGRSRGPAKVRGLLAYLVRNDPSRTLAELARRSGRDVVTLSLAASRWQALMGTDEGARKLFERASAQLQE